MNDNDKSTAYWTPIPDGATGVSSTCLNYPPRPLRLNFNHNPHPGFGVLVLRLDGVAVDGSPHSEGGRTLIRKWEAQAAADPDQKWTIEVDGPMTAVLYERRGIRQWIATHRGMGFA